MRTELLEEFIVCASTLSIKTAASNLHMAQSNLSKHIKQIEEEIGVELFSHTGNKLNLTEAGEHFFDGASSIMNLYSGIREACHLLNDSEDLEKPLHLTIQQHSLVDQGVEEYYRFINRIHKSEPEISIFFAKASRRSFFEELKAGRLDLCLDYRCGVVSECLRNYQKQNFLAKHLHSEPLAIWCHNEFSFAERATVSVKELFGIPVMAPCDASAPMPRAVKQLCQLYGFEPTFLSIASTNQPEFLNSYYTNAIYIYPYSFTQSHLLRGFDEMVAIPFAEEDAQVHTFAVANKLSGPFAAELNYCFN